MLVVPGMADSLDSFFKRHEAAATCKKCTYITPVYEIKKEITTMPKSKKELLELKKKGLARPFHIEVRS